MLSCVISVILFPHCFVSLCISLYVRCAVATRCAYRTVPGLMPSPSALFFQGRAGENISLSDTAVIAAGIILPSRPLCTDVLLSIPGSALALKVLISAGLAVPRVLLPREKKKQLCKEPAVLGEELHFCAEPLAAPSPRDQALPPGLETAAMASLRAFTNQEMLLAAAMPVTAGSSGFLRSNGESREFANRNHPRLQREQTQAFRSRSARRHGSPFSPGRQGYKQRRALPGAPTPRGPPASSPGTERGAPPRVLTRAPLRRGRAVPCSQPGGSGPCLPRGAVPPSPAASHAARAMAAPRAALLLPALAALLAVPMAARAPPRSVGRLGSGRVGSGGAGRGARSPAGLRHRASGAPPTAAPLCPQPWWAPGWAARPSPTSCSSTSGRRCSWTCTSRAAWAAGWPQSPSTSSSTRAGPRPSTRSACTCRTSSRRWVSAV